MVTYRSARPTLTSNHFHFISSFGHEATVASTEGFSVVVNGYAVWYYGELMHARYLKPVIRTILIMSGIATI
jgi:hypothetical protein